VTTLHYVVGGETFDVEAEEPGVQGGGARDDRQLTLTTTPDVWARLIGGDLDPVVAYMQGRLKVAGDMSALYDLLPTIPLPSA
jgi:putative sterol carrier protein